MFAEAQLKLLDEVESATDRRCSASDRLDFVRSYDQALAAKHHLHFRYPPIMLVFALTDGLAGVDSGAAAGAAITGSRLLRSPSVDIAEAIVGKYLGWLNRVPPLLPGVLEGLRLAGDSQLPVYVITEGKIEKQRKTVGHYNLEDRIAGIFEITKNLSSFDRLRQRFSPAQVIVIGDQPDRDIAPAQSAECTTVLVPSRFRPTWNVDAWNEASYVASDYQAAIAWAVERGKSGG